MLGDKVKALMDKLKNLPYAINMIEGIKELDELIEKANRVDELESELEAECTEVGKLELWIDNLTDVNKNLLKEKLLVKKMMTFGEGVKEIKYSTIANMQTRVEELEQDALLGEALRYAVKSELTFDDEAMPEREIILLEKDIEVILKNHQQQLEKEEPNEI